VSKLDHNKLVAFMNDRDLANLSFSTKDHAVLSELVNVLEPFAEATTVCQGDETATIGVIVPSVVSLYKHLKALTRTSKYNVPVVKALLGALTARFKGLLQILRIVELPTDEEADTMTFGKAIYLVASVLDPVYGFIWLEADHPGSPEVKSALRSYITDAIIHQASLVDDKHPSNSDQSFVPAENDSNTCASSSNTQPSLKDCYDTAPETKKRRSTLFASYEHRREIESQVLNCVTTIALFKPITKNSFVSRVFDRKDCQYRVKSTCRIIYVSSRRISIYRRLLILGYLSIYCTQIEILISTHH
jgi:hypothetical protein